MAKAKGCGTAITTELLLNEISNYNKEKSLISGTMIE